MMTYNKTVVIRKTAKELRESAREQRARKAQFFMVWRSEIRAAMRRKGINNVSLSELAGKDKGAMTRFFKGGDAKLSTLLALSEALGMKWETPRLEEIKTVFIEKSNHEYFSFVRVLKESNVIDQVCGNNLFITPSDDLNSNSNAIPLSQEGYYTNV